MTMFALLLTAALCVSTGRDLFAELRKENLRLLRANKVLRQALSSVDTEFAVAEKVSEEASVGATGCVEISGYMLYDQQACPGQSQLGIVTQDPAGCAASCSANEECISFEMDVTYSEDNCRLSSTCIVDWAMSWDDQCLYIKLPPTMMPTADPTTTTLTPTQDPTTTLTPTQDPTTTLTPTQDPTTTTTEEPCEDDNELVISEAANYGIGYTISGCSDVVDFTNGKNLCRGRKYGPQIRAACPVTCGVCPEV